MVGEMQHHNVGVLELGLNLTMQRGESGVIPHDIINSGEECIGEGGFDHTGRPLGRILGGAIEIDQHILILQSQRCQEVISTHPQRLILELAVEDAPYSLEGIGRMTEPGEDGIHPTERRALPHSGCRAGMRE